MISFYSPFEGHNSWSAQRPEYYCHQTAVIYAGLPSLSFLGVQRPLVDAYLFARFHFLLAWSSWRPYLLRLFLISRAAVFFRREFMAPRLPLLPVHASFTVPIYGEPASLYVGICFCVWVVAGRKFVCTRGHSGLIFLSRWVLFFFALLVLRFMFDSLDLLFQQTL